MGRSERAERLRHPAGTPRALARADRLATRRLRTHAPSRRRADALSRRQGDQLRRRAVALPSTASARRAGPGERGAVARLTSGDDRRPAVLARPVAGGISLLLAVEVDDVPLLGRPAVIAGGETEHLRAPDALVAESRMRELLQPLQLHALERQDVFLRLRPTATVVADHSVGPNDAVTRDEIRDRVVGQRRPDGAHRRGVPDLTRDPTIWAHLAARDLESLAQDRLRERGQAAKVESQPPRALELVLDLRRQVRRRVDAHQPAPDLLVEPGLELRRGLASHRGRNTEPVPRHVNRSEHGLEHRI